MAGNSNSGEIMPGSSRLGSSNSNTSDPESSDSEEMAPGSSDAEERSSTPLGSGEVVPGLVPDEPASYEQKDAENEKCNHGRNQELVESPDELGAMCQELVEASPKPELEVKYEQAFITRWKTTEPEESIAIPTAPETGYFAVIDWGDGTTEQIEGVNPDLEHTYAEPSIYIVAIEGYFSRLFLNACGSWSDGDKANANKLQTVEQWGPIPWRSMESAFAGASDVQIRARDVPNLSAVTDMSRMFMGASSFNQDIGGWDVSNVRSMRETFRGASSFNQDIRRWDVSNVESMWSMFAGARSFNQDLSGWEVSNVEHMNGMFDGASSMNPSHTPPGAPRPDAHEGQEIVEAS